MSIPFGSTATLLDSFTGADENPLREGGNWARVEPPSVNPADAQRLGNAYCGTEVLPSFAIGNLYWTQRYFGPDVDVYMTITGGIGSGGGGGGYLLEVRGQNPTDGTHFNYSAYLLQITGGSTWRLFTLINGAPDTTVGTATQAIATGDKMGFRAQGNVISGWWNDVSTGIWTQVLSYTDTSNLLTGEGFVAIATDNTTATVTNLHAGNLPTASAVQVIKYRRDILR